MDRFDIAELPVAWRVRHAAAARGGGAPRLSWVAERAAFRVARRGAKEAPVAGVLRPAGGGGEIVYRVARLPAGDGAGDARVALVAPLESLAFSGPRPGRGPGPEGAFDPLLRGPLMPPRSALLGGASPLGDADSVDWRTPGELGRVLRSERDAAVSAAARAAETALVLVDGVPHAACRAPLVVREWPVEPWTGQAANPGAPPVCRVEVSPGGPINLT